MDLINDDEFQNAFLITCPYLLPHFVLFVIYIFPTIFSVHVITFASATYTAGHEYFGHTLDIFVGLNYFYSFSEMLRAFVG